MYCRIHITNVLLLLFMFISVTVAVLIPIAIHLRLLLWIVPIMMIFAFPEHRMFLYVNRVTKY